MPDLDVFQGDDVPRADAVERVSGRCRPDGRGEESAGDGLEHGGLRERSVIDDERPARGLRA